MWTWRNAVNCSTSPTTKFLWWNNQPTGKLCLNTVHICLYHRGSNNSGSSTGAVKWPIFWGIGCWWADEEEGGSASWVVPNFVRTPILRRCGYLGLHRAVRVFAAGGRVAFSQHWPLTPWRPSLSGLMYIFQRRARWGEATGTQQRLLCAPFITIPLPDVCRTIQMQAVEGTRGGIYLVISIIV